MRVILTKEELERLQKANGRVEITTDLGKSFTRFNVKDEKVEFDGQILDLTKLPKLDEKTCYTILDNKLVKIQFFSDETNRFYKLNPTKDWPTVSLSSTPMHKVSASTPKQDTFTRMKALGDIKGSALDTCCGLGYTAIQLAKHCDEVFTFEKDPNVLEIAKYNPYSDDLFTNKKIKLKVEDIFEEIKKLDKNYFDVIIHDPPTVKYAMELYSLDFYNELYRVLKRYGKIYHYTPLPQIKTTKRFFPDEVKKRLLKAKFQSVKYVEQCQGFVFSK